MPGFYQGADGKCAPCGAGCQSCTNATVCLICATAASNNGDGTCSCRLGSIVVIFSASLYCQPCSTNCATCSVVSTNCTSCKTGFVLQSNVCVCPIGTFVTPDGTQCVPCSSNCIVCTNATTCTKCAPSYIFDNTTKQCALNCL